MSDLQIFIDDSGQLNPNYKFGSIFTYSGFWCLSDDLARIESFYGVLKKQIFHTKKEIKASSMKNRVEKQIIRRIISKFPNKFHPIFECVDVTKLDQVDFDSKQAVQIHKNYCVRRLIEVAIRQKRRLYKDFDVDTVQIFIDNQSQTILTNYDSLERYINKSLSNYYFRESSVTSDKKCTVTYKDSKTSNAIQICDVLANSKFRNQNKKFNDFSAMLKDNNIEYPLKLPVRWSKH